jgi:hypothetical protein
MLTSTKTVVPGCASPRSPSRTATTSPRLSVSCWMDLLESSRATFCASGGDLRAAGQIADFFRWIARKYEAQGTAIAGKWTNEGDVTAAAEGRLPPHYVHLYLRVEGSDVSGIVESRALDSGTTLPNGSLNGQRRWGRISASVVDVRRGRLITSGRVVLRCPKRRCYGSTIRKQSNGSRKCSRNSKASGARTLVVRGVANLYKALLLRPPMFVRQEARAEHGKPRPQRSERPPNAGWTEWRIDEKHLHDR